ncbi:MAG TPA: squalene/phytoene synthase family protein, partial [Ktedonobacterales bacterium]
MGSPTKTWEYTLLARAYEALHSPAPTRLVQNERAICSDAHTYCARLIRANSRTFYLASALLPAPKRHAVRTLYAFCRATDDL